MLSSDISTHAEVAPDPIKVPFAYAKVTLSKTDFIELKAQAKQWRIQWQRTRIREQEALDRIKQMKVEHAREVETLQDQIDTLKNHLAEAQHLVFWTFHREACHLSETGRTNCHRSVQGTGKPPIHRCVCRIPDISRIKATCKDSSRDDLARTVIQEILNKYGAHRLQDIWPYLARGLEQSNNKSKVTFLAELKPSLFKSSATDSDSSSSSDESSEDRTLTATLQILDNIKQELTCDICFHPFGDGGEHKPMFLNCEGGHSTVQKLHWRYGILPYLL